MDVAEGLDGIRTSVVINGELQKRISRVLRVCSIVHIVCGALLLGLGIVGLVFDIESRGENDVWLYYWMSVMGVVFIALGINLVLQIGKNIKTAEKLNVEQQYFFTQSYVEITTLRHGETSGVVKSFFADFYKVKETKEFLLLYPNTASAYPVEKSKLTAEELEKLRSILPMKKKR